MMSGCQIIGKLFLPFNLVLNFTLTYEFKY